MTNNRKKRSGKQPVLDRGNRTNKLPDYFDCESKHGNCRYGQLLAG